jgi:hypothetical protein
MSVAVASLVIAACGGGDNARDVLSGADDTVATVPATDPEPVDTDPPATDAPADTVPVTTAAADDSSSTTTVADDEPGGDLAAFCGASEQFYVESEALNSIDGDADAAARSLFNDMSVSVAGAIFNAPTPEVAAAPQQMQAVLGTLLPALDAVDYDIDAVGDLPNADEVNGAFVEFGTIVGQLRTFIVEECGADLDELAAAAVAKADAASGSATTEPVDSTPATTIAPDVDVDGDAIFVEDASGTITASVPPSWNIIDGTPDGDLRQLIAAPDAEAFLGSFAASGVIIVSGDAPNGNGDEAGAAGLDGLSASIQADGCVLGSEAPYDDGVYTGTERIYSCPGTDAVARFAGGTNFDSDLFWLLGVVYQPAEIGVWELITESFLVD